MTKNSKRRKQFFGLKQDALISPNSTETVTYFVANESKKSAFDLKLNADTNQETLTVYV